KTDHLSDEQLKAVPAAWNYFLPLFQTFRPRDLSIVGVKQERQQMANDLLKCCFPFTHKISVGAARCCDATENAYIVVEPILRQRCLRVLWLRCIITDPDHLMRIIRQSDNLVNVRLFNAKIDIAQIQQ